MTAPDFAIQNAIMYQITLAEQPQILRNNPYFVHDETIKMYKSPLPS